MTTEFIRFEKIIGVHRGIIGCESSPTTAKMQFTLKIALIALFYLVTGISSSCDKSILPELTFRLTGTNLDWPCFSTKNIYSSTGRYIPKHVIATRAQIYRDEAFVALPRYRSGVPFSLGVVSLKKGQCSTSIRPYPSWELQEEGNCNALQNVVDIFLDNQVIDDGCAIAKTNRDEDEMDSNIFCFLFQ